MFYTFFAQSYKVIDVYFNKILSSACTQKLIKKNFGRFQTFFFFSDEKEEKHLKNKKMNENLNSFPVLQYQKAG